MPRGKGQIFVLVREGDQQKASEQHEGEQHLLGGVVRQNRQKQSKNCGADIQLGWEFTKNLETIVREVKKCAEDKVNWEKYLDNLRMTPEMRSEIPDLEVVVVPKCDWLLPIKLEIQPSVDLESVQKTYENYFVGKS